MHRNTWVELSRENLINNLTQLRSLVTKPAKLMFVVKANAYGHGLMEILTIAESEPGIADAYGVHSVDEAEELRACGVKKPVYILGYTSLAQIPKLFDLQATPIITNLETLDRISQLSRERNIPIKIHLKCETGTYRQGILYEDIPQYLSIFRSNPLLTLEGLTTHFANIEDTTDHSYAFKQLDRFNDFLTLVRNEGFTPDNNHVACSAALILFPQTHFSMVRAGISSYGFWSSKETYLSHMTLNENKICLKPVLTWKTLVGHIKSIPPDSLIGYGGTFKTTTATKIAVLPIGYYDGYDRKLSNVSYVLINGKRAPVRGRVCMNMIIVDVTHIPDISLENEVMLIGESGGDAITADTIASLTGSINYEIVTRINPKIERMII